MGQTPRVKGGVSLSVPPLARGRTPDKNSGSRTGRGLASREGGRAP